ncbi:MAG: XrtA system polysaccharide deacetylase [Planctomycetota bacterium]|jgi:polysaccharide deacetylase family protein (PEP-CTERM system associated)
MKHALTVDVEDWYHVENLRRVVPPERWSGMPARLEGNVERLLALFDAHAVKATFFVLGVAAERHPDVVRRIAEAGHEVASHGWSHDLVYRQDPETFRNETRRSKALLEDLSGTRVDGYRASTFSITERSLWALDVIAEEGLRYDSSLAPLRHDRYGLPGAPSQPHVRSLRGGGTLLEFPPSFFRVLGWRLPLGGGFFRLFPLRWLLKGLARYAAQGTSGGIFLHPWEIDPDQPRVEGLGLLPRFRHYVGLARTQCKLARLLRAASFTTMGEILAAAFPDVGVGAV